MFDSGIFVLSPEEGVMGYVPLLSAATDGYVILYPAAGICVR